MGKQWEYLAAQPWPEIVLTQFCAAILAELPPKRRPVVLDRWRKLVTPPDLGNVTMIREPEDVLAVRAVPTALELVERVSPIIKRSAARFD